MIDIDCLVDELEGKALLDHTHKVSDITDIFNAIYPVGAIYASMNSTIPESLFGFGKWIQITDRFLYCADSSLVTGGSKKISASQLSAQSHSYTVLNDRICNQDGASYTAASRYNYWRCNKDLTRNATTSLIGVGDDYMPPYITVYAWYRTA